MLLELRRWMVPPGHQVLLRDVTWSYSVSTQSAHFPQIPVQQVIPQYQERSAGKHGAGNQAQHDSDGVLWTPKYS